MRCQKNEFGAMDPNVKLFLEEMSKQLRTEIAVVKLTRVGLTVFYVGTMVYLKLQPYVQ
jgi:hypothetical protein